jgi:hypothetical protein
MDSSGETGTLQQRALAMLARVREHGLTSREFGLLIRKPHQTYSSVMSVLHKAGLVERLTERRTESEVYVLPEFVDGRTTAPRRMSAAENTLAALDAEVARFEEHGAQWMKTERIRAILGRRA